MSLYDLPSFPQLPRKPRRMLAFIRGKFRMPRLHIKMPSFFQEKAALFVAGIFVGAVVAGFFGGLAGSYYAKGGGLFSRELIDLQSTFSPGFETSYVPQTTQEEKIIGAVESVSPAVVSIVITKDVPIVEQYFVNPFGEGSPFKVEVPQYRQRGTEKKEVGGGSGFIVAADGLVVTNKHVVLDEKAEYTVFTNDGKSYPAKVLARDPVQDLAILKIENPNGGFPVANLGDSDALQIGQTVIAIGNALGEFRNTVSTGVVSGLGRTITATGGTFVETIEDVIQTDAAINQGNSGGPLLNLAGQVIGMDTATVSGAQSIGFAIPINKVRRSIDQVRKGGEITYAFLGVRYVGVTSAVQKDRNLTVDYGALVVRGESGEAAIEPGSPAAKAGLRAGDVILRLNGERITQDNSLGTIIQKYDPGDFVTLTIFSGSQEKTINVELGSRTQ
ncbi:MAG: trypsin-like peptidase domain-containing protein [Parcubacteria group bacterium]|nr:trypsin-like peptidase domain-containing protein [Parcubacteria group bacterium]